MRMRSLRSSVVQCRLTGPANCGATQDSAIQTSPRFSASISRSSNRTGEAWGAHVAIVFGDFLLHLSAEVGWPALWSWEEFAVRERYSRLVGVVRAPQSGVD